MLFQKDTQYHDLDVWYLYYEYLREGDCVLWRLDSIWVLLFTALYIV